MSTQNSIGQPFIQLAEVESTNNYATAQAQVQMAVHGTTWFAHSQTAGKGQRGKTWNMEPRQNIIMSTVIDPQPLLLKDSFILSATVALACHDFFATYAAHDTCIKWPNDLYWRDRKAGGILIENVLQGSKWKFAVVGIGININQTIFPSFLPNPVSLKQITGKQFDCIGLAHELCYYLEKRWQQVFNIPHETILKEYINKMYKLNEEVLFKKNGSLFKALVKGVNERGELMIFRDVIETVVHGEVEWLLS